MFRLRLSTRTHTHTQTHAHIHTVMHACTDKHTTPYTWMRDRFNPVSRTEANSEAHFMPEINKGVISQQTSGENKSVLSLYAILYLYSTTFKW